MPSRASFDPAQSQRADTLVSRFLDVASRDPERVVYTMFPMGALNALGQLNWGDWVTRARAVSGSLLALHLPKGSRVAIYSTNRELWPVAMLGAAMAGLVTVSLRPDAPPADLLAQLRDCQPSVVIVDTLARLKLLRAVQAELKYPFTIVCDDLEPLRSSTAESLFELESWVKNGALALQQYEPLRTELALRIEAIQPHDPFSIVYKRNAAVGVVHSHEAMLVMAGALAHDLGITLRERIAVARSFSGMFECLVGVCVPILTGASVALIEHESDSMLASRLHESTIFCGSEAILSDFGHQLQRASRDNEDARDIMAQQLGELCRTMLLESGGVATDVALDAQLSGIVLVTIYGTPEQACICRNGPSDWRDDSIGAPLAATEIRQDETGELQVRRGPMTCTTWYGRDEEFRRMFTADGLWLRTGDRVERLSDDRFRIAGSMGDLIRLPGGATTNSLDIEAALSSLPHVAHAICHGGPDKPLVAVLSLHRKRVEKWALEQGIVAPWAALIDHPLVYDELARGVAGINQFRAEGEHVVAFAPTEVEFSVHSGELDHAGKPVRAVLLAQFEHVFADLHSRRSR